MNRRCSTLLALLAATLLAAGCDNSSSAATPASVADALARGQLGGLYVRQRNIPLFMNGRMTFNLVRDYYYFFPDGHMLFGVPTAPGSLKEHPTAEDFAAFKDVEASQRGTYAVRDGKIAITPDSGTASTEAFSVPKAGDDRVLQIGEASIVGSVKAVPFTDGQTLDGSYQFDGTVGLGTSQTIFNVNTLTFKPDGTLASDQLSGIDSQGEKTGVTAGGTTANAGTYKLSGYTLTTTVAGKSAAQSAFRWAGESQETTPGMICLAGRVYSRQER